VLDRPTWQRIAEFVQTCWHDQLGVQSTWFALGYEAATERATRQPPDVTWIQWTADYPDPDNFLRVALTLQRRFMRWQWQSEAHDSLVEEARKITSMRDRIHAYQEADRILTQSAALVPLLYLRDHLLVKPWLRNCTRSPTEDWFWKDVIIEPH